jgi:hypothetical protein
MERACADCLVLADDHGELKSFMAEVSAGLSASPKRLHSRFFYDQLGGGLFRSITTLPEYYLTGCELEILRKSGRKIASLVGAREFNLVELGSGDGSKVIHLIDPVGYLDMLALERDAAAIVTDSGGVQEESCMLRTPCVTVRRNTERWVTLQVGSNRLVDADRDQILTGLSAALTLPKDWAFPERWDDEVSGRVVTALKSGILPLGGCA